MAEVDVVSVYHKDENFELFTELSTAIEQWEQGRVEVFGVDNRVLNRGFSKGCNIGARLGSAPVIGFINPDAWIEGRFVDRVMEVFGDPTVVITGERYNKSALELKTWGVSDWVCGACFFVRRDFFESEGGFDEQFVWGWEETDLIRRAEARGLKCRSVNLPIYHQSPSENTKQEIEYKEKYFNDGARRFFKKWR